MRERDGRKGKHLQTQGGCHEKVGLFESNEVFEGLYKSSIDLHSTPCFLLDLIPLSTLCSFRYPIVNLKATESMETLKNIFAVG